MKTVLLLSLTTIALIGMGRAAIALRRRDTSQTQARRLAAAMRWRRGETIAEIGAGEGSIAAFVAEHVGPSGRVYANEIDPDKIAKIESVAARRHLENLVSVKGSETSTSLAENSCDAIFVRLAYHHFTQPQEINTSIFRALRPGGLFAVADFSPNLVDWLAAMIRFHRVDGVRRERVLREVEAAGFVDVGDVERWPGKGYCLLFRKPAVVEKQFTPTVSSEHANSRLTVSSIRGPSDDSGVAGRRSILVRGPVR